MVSPIKKLQALFASYANSDLAVGMSAYMKNKFPYLWIQTPNRKIVEKERLGSFVCQTREEVKDLSIELWNKSEREYQYVAITLLQKYKKLWKVESIIHFERLVLNKSRWDSVDSIDTNLVGQYFLLFSKDTSKTVLARAKSDNIRLQRTALQFQLLYKDKTDALLLEKVLKETADSEEFFVQKAMGRILREYSKTNPKRVKAFIKSHELPKLTIREWSKYI